MVNSLKEIIEGITEIVEANLPEITKVKYSGVMNTDLPRDFPTLYLFCEDPSTLNENHNLITLQMYFTDVQVSQNDEWKKDYEIKSDMMQTASKLFDLLENEGWLDTVNIPLQPFTSDMNDGLSGVQCSVPFIVQKPCIIEEYEHGTPTPEPVTITITSPITGEEFEEGTDITVSYSLSTEENITDVALEIDGVEVQRKTVIFDAFLISGLDLGAHEITLKAYNGGELEATSNVVSLEIVRVPLILTITAPTEEQTFTEGENITVNYSFDRSAPEVTKTELWLNGALIETDSTPPFPTSFVIQDTTEGDKHIEVKAYDGLEELASDSVNVMVEAPAQELLLDIYPNTDGESWSLEQINSNFTGTILELRRDDNDTMLVQFDDGQLPQSAIAVWAGSGKAYVTKWNGQSGNGLFVQQTNAANQPWIYDNGFILEGGQPTMVFAGNQYLDGGDILKGGTNAVISFVVGKTTNNLGSFYAKSIYANMQKRYALLVNGGDIQAAFQPDGGSPEDVTTAAVFIQKLLTQEIIPGISHILYVNNINMKENTGISGTGYVGDTTYNFLIGGYNNGSGGTPPQIYHQGTIQEVNIYLNDVSADRAAITTEIMNRYGIS